MKSILKQSTVPMPIYNFRPQWTVPSFPTDRTEQSTASFVNNFGQHLKHRNTQNSCTNQNYYPNNNRNNISNNINNQHHYLINAARPAERKHIRDIIDPPPPPEVPEPPPIKKSLEELKMVLEL